MKMKKGYIFFLLFLFTGTISFGQTVTDFTKKDCNGKTHNLFSELDSGNAIIIEFFHTCLPCKDAAQAMMPMYQKLRTSYGNKVRFFGIPEDDSYDCSQVLNWVSVNGLISMVTPFDSGSVQAAYYGGMGMPTVAVVAGSGHKILYLVNATTASFATSDTTIIGSKIRNFLDSTFAGIPVISSTVFVNIFPNPAATFLAISVETNQAGTLSLEITTITGDKVAGLTEEKIQAGMWSKNFPVSLSNGVYFITGSLNQRKINQRFTVQH